MCIQSASGGGQIGGHAFDLRTGNFGKDPVLGFLHRLPGPAVDDDAGAGFGKPFRDGKAEALGGTGDDGALAGKIDLHFVARNWWQLRRLGD
jgi:hypothetical protein